MKALTKQVEQQASDYKTYVQPLINIFPHLQRSYTDKQIAEGAKEFLKTMQEFMSGGKNVV